MYGLEGKVALVTGAGGENGIGRGIATRLALEGSDVVVNDLTLNPYDDRPGSWGGVTQVVEEIEALGRKSMAIPADVSNSAQVQAMVVRLLDLSRAPAQDAADALAAAICRAQMGRMAELDIPVRSRRRRARSRRDLLPPLPGSHP